MDRLPKDYENLLQVHLKVQKAYDSTLQSLHENRKQLQIAEALHLDYQEEIRSLSERQEKYENFEEKVQKLAREKSALKAEIGENVRLHQLEIEERDVRIEQLRREIDGNLRNANVETENSTKSELDLEKQVHELTDQVANLEEFIEEFKATQAQLVLENENLKSELSTYQECLKTKSEMLTEATGLLETLRNENANLQLDLDRLKSQPLSKETKGNSLFAEVNDRRVHMEKNYSLMKRKFDEMRKERRGDSEQISRLIHQNAVLVQKLKDEIVEKQEETESVKRQYQEEINTLKDCVKSYKKQIEESTAARPAFSSFREESSFCDKLLKRKNDEMEELRENYRMRALNCNLLSSELSDAGRKIRGLQAEIERLKLEMEKVKQAQINENEVPTDNSDNPNNVSNKGTQTDSESVVKSILKNNTTVVNCQQNDFSIFEETMIDDEPNKVKFREDVKTTDHSVNNVTSFRRGAKISIAKPITYLNR